MTHAETVGIGDLCTLLTDQEATPFQVGQLTLRPLEIRGGLGPTARRGHISSGGSHFRSLTDDAEGFTGTDARDVAGQVVHLDREGTDVLLRLLQVSE